MKPLTIREDFRDLIPPLSPAEFDQLDASISARGCRDPLVVWRGKNILLDGHNRYAICTKRGVEFQTVEIDVSSEDWTNSMLREAGKEMEHGGIQ